MKTSIRAPFSGAVILILCLMTTIAARAQTSIQSRFASAGDVIINAEPTVLIGVSGQPGAFTEAAIRAMAKNVIIFPLSNPISRSEHASTNRRLDQWASLDWRGFRKRPVPTHDATHFLRSHSGLRHS
jgi:hypothetical protein